MGEGYVGAAVLVGVWILGKEDTLSDRGGFSPNSVVVGIFSMENMIYLFWYDCWSGIAVLVISVGLEFWKWSG